MRLNFEPLVTKIANTSKNFSNFCPKETFEQNLSSFRKTLFTFQSGCCLEILVWTSKFFCWNKNTMKRCGRKIPLLKKISRGRWCHNSNNSFFKKIDLGQNLNGPWKNKVVGKFIWTRSPYPSNFPINLKTITTIFGFNYQLPGWGCRFQVSVRHSVVHNIFAKQ